MLKFNISFCVSLSLSKVLSPHTLFIFGACFISSAQGEMLIPELACS